MTDTEQGIHLTVQGDSSSGQEAVRSANSVLTELNSIVDKLGATFAALSAAGDKAASSVSTLGSKVQDTKSHTDHLNQSAHHTVDAFDAVGEHGRTLAMALDAMGVEGDAATMRVAAGVTGMVDAFQTAGPAILGVAAALAVLTSAGIFLGESIAKAGEWNQSLERLGVTVKDQGGNWTYLKQQVIDFATEQEKATIFARDQVVDAMTRLTAAGIKLSDAYIVTRVAEDAAASTGKDLTQINFALMEAMHGRTQALTQLGIGTKQSIHDGMKFNDILAAIEKQMGGSAEAMTNTLPGAIKQLQNSFVSFEQDAGQPFQQSMIDIVHDLTQLVDSIESDTMPYLKEFGTWFSQELPSIEQGASSAFQALANDVGTAYKIVQQFIGFIVDHQEEIKVFFEATIAVVATNAIRSLASSFMELVTAEAVMDAWTGFTLVIEAAAGAINLGIIPAIRAAIVAIYDLAGAEAIASLGITAAIGAIIFILEQLWQHWDEVKQKTLDVMAAMNQLNDAIVSLEDKILHNIPIIGQWADSFKDAADQATKAAQAAAQANHELAQREKGGFTAAQQSVEDQTRADLARESAQMNDHSSTNTNTSINTTVGGKLGGGSKTPYDPKFIEDTTRHVDLLTKAQRSLDDSIKSINESETTYKNNVALAITSQQQAIAQNELEKKQEDDRLAKMKLLNEAIYIEIQHQKSLQNEITEHTAKLHALITAYNANEESMRGETKITVEQKDRKKELGQQIKDLTKTLDQENSELTKNTNNLDKNKDAHQKLADAVVEEAKKRAAALLSINNEIEKDQEKLREDAEIYQIEAYHRLHDLDKNYQQNTIADEIIYLRQRLENIQGFDQEEVQERKSIINQIYSLEEQAYKDRMDLYTKFIDDMQKKEESWLSGLISGQKNLRDTLKEIWTEIVNNFANMIAEMIVKSALMNQINNTIFGVFTGQSTGGLGSMAQSTGSNKAAQGASDGASQYGVLGAFLGTSGAAQVVSSLPGVGSTATVQGGQAPATAVALIGDSGANSSASTTQGVIANVVSSQSGSSNIDLSSVTQGLVSQGMDPATAASVAQSLYSNAGMSAGGGVVMAGTNPAVDAAGNAGIDAANAAGGSSSSSSVGGAGNLLQQMWNGKGIWGDKTIGAKGTLGSLGLGIGAGLMFGSMMGGGTHSTWGAIGGAVGSIFGPVGSIVGGFFGSLFGHVDDPSKMPDKYNTQQYGQAYANYMGTDQANGVNFSIDPSVQQQLGGMTEQQYIAKFMTNPQAQTVLGSHLYSLFSGDSSIQRLHDGNLYLGNGQSEYWTNFFDDVSQAVNLIGTAEGSTAGATPIYSFDHSLPDYAGAQVSSSGSYTPGAPPVTGSPTGPTNGNNPPAPGGTSPPPVYAPPVTAPPVTIPPVTPPGKNPPGHIINPPGHIINPPHNRDDVHAGPTGSGGVDVIIQVNGSVLTDKHLADVVSKVVADRMNMRTMQSQLRK